MVRRSRLRVQSNKRGGLVPFLATLLLIILIVCAFIYRKNLSELGSSVFTTKAKKSLSARGTIFDRNYKELAVSLDRVSVYARTREIKSRHEVANQLGPLFGKNVSDLEKSLRGDSLRVWLAKNISQLQEEEVQALNLEGIYLHREVERYYPRNKKAAHIVGFVEDDIGLAGVEYHYNKLLSEYGVVRQDGNKPSETHDIGVKDGQYLVLTIDLKIQDILEKFVADIAGDKEDLQAGVILMDCSTGDIIGNAMYPSYDPNRFRDYIKEHLNNTLAEPLVIPDKYRQVFRDAALIQAQFEKGSKLLPWSINAEIGSLGSQVRLWEKLQLEKPLDLDFITKKGVGKEKIQPLPGRNHDFETVPEVATPLHLLDAVNRLITDSKNVAPHVVDRFRNRWGEEIFPQNIPSEVFAKDILDNKVSKEIIFLLTSQMERGPLTSGFLEDQSVFLLEKNDRQELIKSTVMMSLIPAKKPEFILLASVMSKGEEPSHKKKKSHESLIDPAKKIILPLVALQEVMKNLSDMMTVEEREEVNYQLEQEKKRVAARKEVDDMEKRLMVMPDLQGFSLRKSLRILQDFELEIRIEGTGKVVGQEPRAGTVLGSTKECKLILERGRRDVDKNVRK